MPQRRLSRAVRPVTTVATARGGTQEDLRRHNLGAVLTHLHIGGALSRAELTARMGLNRSTIAGLVNELAALGAVREHQPAGSRNVVGRPSLVVEPNAESVQVLAADIGVDRVVLALVGLGGTVLVRRRQRTPASRSPAAVAALVARLARSLLLEPQAGRVLGLGVSVPGVVRLGDGYVPFAPNLGWVNQPFGELLAELLPGLPLWMGNDADLGLIAEHRHGAAQDIENAIFLAGGVGVGGGLLLGGLPMSGAGGYAGELGHMLVRRNGRRCRCGGQGCWETEIGAPAVARALGLAPDTDTDTLIEALTRAAESDAAGLQSNLAGVGDYLGVGLATLINVVNPQLIMMGGLLGYVYSQVELVVEERLAESALSAPREQVRITVAELGDDAPLQGASELAWRDLLADPIAALAPAGLAQQG